MLAKLSARQMRTRFVYEAQAMVGHAVADERTHVIEGLLSSQCAIHGAFPGAASLRRIV